MSHIGRTIPLPDNDWSQDRTSTRNRDLVCGTRKRRIYILAEHGYKANWVQNILANPSVTIRLMGRLWQASGRVLEPDRDGDLYAEVRELAREKYGWGNGLPIEFRLERQI